MLYSIWLAPNDLFACHARPYVVLTNLTRAFRRSGEGDRVGCHQIIQADLARVAKSNLVGCTLRAIALQGTMNVGDSLALKLY